MSSPDPAPRGIQDLSRELAGHLEALRQEMAELERMLSAELHPDHQAGARNLLHYVALRRHDIRELQHHLAALGLSSLGRTESNVLGAVQTVLGVLETLAKNPPSGATPDLLAGRRRLERNTEVLLGPSPAGRRVRIMVTMPSEAATDPALVRDLVASGMNCMRINTAHDGPEAWAAMIRHLRQAEGELGVRCKVEMDLAGPKLRTGPIEPGPPVVKYRPRRDALGRVTAPARVYFTPKEHPHPPAGPADAVLPVPRRWLAYLAAGAQVRFKDTRGARRILRVTRPEGSGWWAEGERTAYVAPGVTLTLGATATSPAHRTRIGPLPPTVQTIPLRPGDTLLLTRSLEPGRPASTGEPARIGVTLPEFFTSVRPGDPIWLDDGAIGGVVESVTGEQAAVRIRQTRPGGDKLGAEKGINIPKTDLQVSSLSAEDVAALEFITRHADIVGLSFVRTPADVRDLRGRLAALGREDLGIVLKIETERAFQNLPQILLETMHAGAVGVMIARGDLAVECGYERLAELQEEILWIAEAAHVPVIWATQVLESLAKTGRPSRAEITDAAMGERAECVMLNKGPYVVAAVRVLDDILRRMEAHQEKKTAMLRKLRVASAFAPHGLQ
jgi:pyruvate kinase